MPPPLVLHGFASQRPLPRRTVFSCSSPRDATGHHRKRVGVVLSPRLIGLGGAVPALAWVLTIAASVLQVQPYPAMGGIPQASDHEQIWQGHERGRRHAWLVGEHWQGTTWNVYARRLECKARLGSRAVLRGDVYSHPHLREQRRPGLIPFERHHNARGTSRGTASSSWAATTALECRQWRRYVALRSIVLYPCTI